MLRFEDKTDGAVADPSVPSTQEVSEEPPPIVTKKRHRGPLGAENARKKLLEKLVLGGEREFFEKLEKKPSVEEPKEVSRLRVGSRESEALRQGVL